MANDILGGVQAGVGLLGTLSGIQSQKARTKLAEEQFEFGVQQAELQQQELAKEQAIEADKRRRTQLTQELARNDALLQSPDVMQNEVLFNKLVNRSNTITSELSPGSVNIDPQKIRNNFKGWQADNKALDLMDKEFGENSPEASEFNDELQIKWELFPKRVAELKERAEFGVKETQAGITTAREQKEALTGQAALAKQQKVQKEEIRKETSTRMGDALRKAGFGEQEIAVATSGVSATVAAKLLPGEDVSTKQVIQRKTGEIDFNTGLEKSVPSLVFVDDKGNFTYQDATPSGVPEAPAAQPSPQPTQAPAPTAPAREEPAIDLPKWLFNAPTEERQFYSRLLAANPEIEDITESEFKDAYAKFLKAEEKKRAAEAKRVKTGGLLKLGGTRSPRLTLKQKEAAAKGVQKALK